MNDNLQDWINQIHEEHKEMERVYEKIARTVKQESVRIGFRR